MSSTDELRRLLDERGVEHEDDEDVTRFFGPDGFEVVMQEDIDGKLDCLTPIYLAPEQAVAATLGAGTCKRVFYEPTGVYVCSECGRGLSKKLDKYCYLHYCPNCGRRIEQ